MCWAFPKTILALGVAVGMRGTAAQPTPFPLGTATGDVLLPLGADVSGELANPAAPTHDVFRNLDRRGLVHEQWIRGILDHTEPKNWGIREHLFHVFGYRQWRNRSEPDMVARGE
jgi:hypothetical protein